MSYGPPPAEPPTGSPDGFSIAALVTGIACTGPVAFTLGAIGLHRTDRRRGRGFAIAGLALGALQMAVGGVVAASVGVGAATTAFSDSDVVIDDLAVGDCFTTGEDGGLAGTVDRIDCDDRHEAEMISVTDVGGGEYPGAAYLEGYADETCSAEVTDAVASAGLDVTDFDYGYYYPLAENWAAGSHLVQCTVYGWDGFLVGSVREGSARLSS